MTCRVKRLEVRLADRKHPPLGDPEISQMGLRPHGPWSAEILVSQHRSVSVCHLAKISCKLGRSVHFDPKTERFVNDPEADRMLTRSLRAPWRF